MQNLRELRRVGRGWAPGHHGALRHAANAQQAGEGRQAVVDEGRGVKRDFLYPRLLHSG